MYISVYYIVIWTRVNCCYCLLNSIIVSRMTKKSVFQLLIRSVLLLEWSGEKEASWAHPTGRQYLSTKRLHLETENGSPAAAVTAPASSNCCLSCILRFPRLSFPGPSASELLPLSFLVKIINSADGNRLEEKRSNKADDIWRMKRMRRQLWQGRL